MKIPRSIIISFLISYIALGCIIVYNYKKYPKDKITITEPQRPKLTMDLIGVTPHGHQIYSKRVEDNGVHTTIYVLLRASDGYPIAITK